MEDRTVVFLPDIWTTLGKKEKVDVYKQVNRQEVEVEEEVEVDIEVEEGEAKEGMQHTLPNLCVHRLFESLTEAGKRLRVRKSGNPCNITKSNCFTFLAVNPNTSHIVFKVSDSPSKKVAKLNLAFNSQWVSTTIVFT